MDVGRAYLVKVSTPLTYPQMSRALTGESHLALGSREGTYRLTGVRRGGWLEVVRMT